jgi:hypothetical protein
MAEKAVAATHDQAVAGKQARARELVTTTPVKTWHHIVEATPDDVVTFLNLPPAQIAGEAFASNRADGQIDLYYFL